jgi:MFS family permease
VSRRTAASSTSRANINGSICFMTVSVVPSQWFSRKRGLANGIVFAGGGLGGAAISVSMDQLAQSLGPAWTLRIIGFLTLATGLPAAMLVKERAHLRRTTFVQWSLFRTLRFDMLFIAGMIGTFPLFVPPFFLPLFCESIGLRAGTGAAVVALFNFSSAIGRISLGLLCDFIGPLNVLFLTLVFGGISMLGLWPFSGTLAPLIVFAIWNGIANGGFFAVVPTVIGSVFGAEKVPLTMGMIVTGWAGGYMMGGPIAGYILNAYLGKRSGIDAYRPAMFYAGSMSLGAAMCVAFVRIHMQRSIMRKV